MGVFWTNISICFLMVFCHDFFLLNGPDATEDVHWSLLAGHALRYFPGMFHELCRLVTGLFHPCINEVKQSIDPYLMWHPSPLGSNDRLACRRLNWTATLKAKFEKLGSCMHATVDGWNPANQLIGSLSHYWQSFIHPRWCRISSINSSSVHFCPFFLRGWRKSLLRFYCVLLYPARWKQRWVFSFETFSTGNRSSLVSGQNSTGNPQGQLQTWLHPRSLT